MSVSEDPHWRTIQEGGIVYASLRKAMERDGLQVSEHDMHAWHGAKKEDTIAHFAGAQGTPEADLPARVKRIAAIFQELIAEAYFGDISPVRLIDDGLMPWIAGLQARGTKVALDTGYPPKTQKGLKDKLGLKGAVDACVSAYDLGEDVTLCWASNETAWFTRTITVAFSHRNELATERKGEQRPDRIY